MQALSALLHAHLGEKLGQAVPSWPQCWSNSPPWDIWKAQGSHSFRPSSSSTRDRDRQWSAAAPA